MGRHPWEVTLREFIEHARRERGVTFEVVPLSIVGLPVEYYLTNAHDLHRTIALPPGVALDDVLAPDLLRSLCRQLDFPEDDFHLDPEPEAD
jgi:hypothetical protein